jgi:crotonobetainyl-CoA:carnitine CoA-transferase CaiB-like acyl-CoA transferase
MLSPYRVLDLTEGGAALGPMILADLGADVIKIEPPGGSPSRRTAPVDPSLPPDVAGLEFAAFNRNKRSIVLDLAEAAGRERFLQLVAGAEFLFESASPGAMAANGLGFGQLRDINSSLIYIATTPFGQDGPYATHLATDLTLAAMGGMMAVNGNADRAPVRISVPQTWLHAGAESAVAALVAHRRRLQTGEAQFVDVSVQASVFWTLMNAMSAYPIQGADFERNGGQSRLGKWSFPVLYRCADGYVDLSLGLLPTLPAIVRQMVEEGVVPETWRTDDDWTLYFEHLRAARPVVHPLSEVTEKIEAYTSRHARRDLLAVGLTIGVSFAPVNTSADVLEMEQLTLRNYWRPLTLADGRTLRTPGPFARFSRTPIEQRRGVPAPGEHTGRILRDLSAATAATPARARSTKQPQLPFSGLKVADFSWVGVGPMTAKYLADHGATTVHIETSTRPDVLRRGAPFKDAVAGINRSQYFGAFNTSKQSIALDLKHPSGRQIALRLLDWADVCLESFRPGTMASLDLDYAAAATRNPGIIYVSTCLMGQTGPLAPLAGFGFHAAAMAGFPEFTGWPDRPPSGPFAPYTDTIANRILAASIMAAIEHRRRTGEGQYIEQSQLEASLHFLAPQILDYQATGAIAHRAGNDSPTAAPHGAYPCSGDDQWCAIAVETDEQWQALQRLMGEPDWMSARELCTSAGRIARRAAIDEVLAEWTRPQAPYTLMEKLQSAGIPAGVVQRSSDLSCDVQLQHRRFFHPLQHAEMGEVAYEGHQFRIRGYESGPRSASPALGEHSAEVMRDLLGMTDDEIAEVAASGALV